MGMRRWASQNLAEVKGRGTDLVDPLLPRGSCNCYGDSNREKEPGGGGGGHMISKGKCMFGFRLKPDTQEIFNSYTAFRTGNYCKFGNVLENLIFAKYS